jgi:hypothetical protein
MARNRTPRGTLQVRTEGVCSAGKSFLTCSRVPVPHVDMVEWLDRGTLSLGYA